MLKRKHWSIMVLVLFVAGLFLFAACGTDAEEEPDPEDPGETVDPPGDEADKYGGTIIKGAHGDIVHFNPLVWLGHLQFSMFYHIYDSLVCMSPGLEVIPQLARDWAIEDDGKTYIFYLDEDARWHDGQPVTADDVVFTFAAHLNPNVSSAIRPDLASLVGFAELTDADNPLMFDDLDVKPVEALDDHTVIFRLEEPFAPFLASLAAPRVPIAPKHIMADESDLNESVMNSAPVGSGPFKFVEWRRDESITLETHEEYHGGRPYVDGVLYDIIPEATMRITALVLGNVDVLLYPPADYWQRLIDNPDIGTIAAEDSITFRTLTINHNRPPLDELLVRRALSHAIDSQEIVDVWEAGFATPAHGPIGQVSWAYEENVTRYPRDVERGRELLVEAGFSPNDDGMMVRDGSVLELEAVSSEANIGLHELMQEQLRSIGVSLQITVADAPTRISRLNDSDFDFYYASWSGSGDPHPNFFRRYHSTGARNYYSNPEVDSLLEAAMRTADVEERAAYYREFQQLVTEDAADLYLYHPVRFYAFTADLHGIPANPITEHGLKYFREAWFDPAR